MRKRIKHKYQEYRKRGWRASDALRSAKVRNAFEWAEYNDVVRLEIVPDESPDLSFLDQDCFKDVRQKELDRANNHGVWGVVGQYKCPCCGQWVDSDSCFGFIGDDWQDSGYDIDIMRQTLDDLKTRRGCC